MMEDASRIKNRRRARAPIKAAYPDTLFDFESADVVTNIRSDVIKGKVYKIVSFTKYSQEIATGFDAYVSADDLSIYLTDQLK